MFEIHCYNHNSSNVKKFFNHLNFMKCFNRYLSILFNLLIAIWNAVHTGLDVYYKSRLNLQCYSKFSVTLKKKRSYMRRRIGLAKSMSCICTKLESVSFIRVETCSKEACAWPALARSRSVRIRGSCSFLLPRHRILQINPTAMALKS